LKAFGAVWNIGALPGFFGLKVIIGLAMLKVSASSLLPIEFLVFSQLFLASSLLNMVSVGGAQTGLIQQIAAGLPEGDDAFARSRLQGAAFSIWGFAILVLGSSSILFARPISVFLTGTLAAATSFPIIVGLSLLSGPGQIYGALLTGSGRSAVTLIAQAIGLVAGAGGAIVMLVAHRPAEAVMAYATGPLVAGAISGMAIRRMGYGWWGQFGDLRQRVKSLLRFSGAFVITASISPILYFVLRNYYRDTFGVTALNEWLVASRISDTTTQLLGLFMVQVFLPRYAKDNEETRSAIFTQSWAAASFIMSLFLMTFLFAPEFIVRTALSSSYVAAIPRIEAYMIGDILRVSTALMMYAAFARAKIWQYIGVEFAVATSIAVFTSILIALDNPAAPFIAYVATHAIATAILFAVWVIFLIRRRKQNANALMLTPRSGFERQ